MKILSFLIGSFCTALILHHGSAQSGTKFDLAEKRSEKREGKKQIPTFVGSDGVVRKVSPSAILEEMKRCLPPGLPIPLATAWPELPPHIGETPEEEPDKTLGDERIPYNPGGGLQEKKRVSRSNDGATKNGDETGVLPGDQNMNVKIEGAANEKVIFSPKDLTHIKIAEVLRDMLSRQMRRQNFTADYGDDINVRARHRKLKNEEYDDYDYAQPEEPPTAYLQERRKGAGPTSETGWRRKLKRANSRKFAHKRSQKTRNIPQNKPDYDYELSSENLENPRMNFQHKRRLDRVRNDELEKQIELNDFLEKNSRAQDGILEESELVDEIRKKPGMLLGDHQNILKGYQKILAVVMKLNTTLIHLLEKLSTGLQKGLSKNHPESAGLGKDGNLEKSTIWEFMDLLLRNGGSRNKRENKHFVDDREDETRAVGGDPSTSKTNMDLLKWLLKWYLTATSM